MKQTVSSGRARAEREAGQSRPASKRGLFITIWISTLLLICAVGALSYAQLQSIQTQQLAAVKSTLANLARVNEEHALRTFRAADQALQFMMARYAAEGKKLDLKALVEKGVIDGSLYAQVGIIDAKGIFQLSNLPFTKGLDLSDREHFRVHTTADTKDLFVSKPVLGRASGKWSIQLTRRINRPDGRFGGVAVVSIDSSYFTRFYADLDLPPKSVATLMGQDGVIRARQLDNKESFGDVIYQGPILRLVSEGKVHGLYTGKSRVDGVERLYAYRKIPDYSLIVVMGISTGELLAMYASSRDALIFQAAALSLLLLVIAGALSRYTWRLQGELVKRHRIATELHTSEEHLALALTGGALGAWDWNLREEEFTSNSQLPDLIGYRPDELKFGKETFVSLIHPDDASEFVASLRRHLKGESESFKSEFRLRHKQGGWVWISLMSKVMERDIRERALRLAGTAHDVTARVDAALALAESEERWNSAITGSNEGIWDWNVPTGTMYVSARLITMLGHETRQSSVTLKDWATYIHPDDMGQAHQQLLLHFKGQSDFYRMELRLRGKDGSYKWMLIRGRALQDKAGRAVRVTGSASDITEQRFAQEQVQDRTEQLNAIFSLSPDAFVSFDRAFRVKYTNPAFQQLTGLNSHAVIGLSEGAFTEKINELCVPSRPFCGLDVLRELSPLKIRMERELVELELPVRRVLHAKLKTSESASVSQILYLRDVTHETIVEDMKTEFLSTAAHELRTPMAGILGFAEVLLTHDLDEAHRHEFTNIILTQSQQITTILDELLDLARIEARKGKDFEFETLNLQTLVQEVVQGFSLSKGRSAPTVTIPPVFCRADRGKAKQAILNVLSNAYKYSPPDSAVEITLATPSAGASHSRIGISIQDHGVGMEKKHLERVFERFYRADTSGRTPGTGLGMSIVKEIMDLHDGDVAIESTVGHGTSVTLRFPAAHGSGVQDAALDTAQVNLASDV